MKASMRRAASSAVLALCRQQDQHVDVGVREKLAAAVAADGEQGGAVGIAVLCPQRE